MHEQYCRGCLSNLLSCEHDSVNESGDCPCTMCLVKVTCVDLCKESHDYLIDKNIGLGPSNMPIYNGGLRDNE
jgi:hypothetical protein